MTCLQCGSPTPPCRNCGHITTPTEIARADALVRAVKTLPESATPTTVAILHDEILEERSKLRIDDDHVVVNTGHARAMIGLLGGSMRAAIMIGVKEQTLNHHIQRGRLPRAVLKKLRMAAIERFTEVIKETPR